MSDYISGIQHIGLPTKDIDATIAFYKQLGFQAAYETVNDGSRVCFLQMKNLCMEVYEAEEVAGKTGAIDHLALDVPDIERAYEEIGKLGLNNLPDEIHFLPFWENGVKYFKIKGPNEEMIEFSQLL